MITLATILTHAVFVDRCVHHCRWCNGVGYSAENHAAGCLIAKAKRERASGFTMRVGLYRQIQCTGEFWPLYLNPGAEAAK